MATLEKKRKPCPLVPEKPWSPRYKPGGKGKKSNSRKSVFKKSASQRDGNAKSPRRKKRRSLLQKRRLLQEAKGRFQTTPADTGEPVREEANYQRERRSGLKKPADRGAVLLPLELGNPRCQRKKLRKKIGEGNRRSSRRKKGFPKRPNRKNVFANPVSKRHSQKAGHPNAPKKQQFGGTCNREVKKGVVNPHRQWGGGSFLEKGH